MAVEHIVELSSPDFGGKSTQASILTYGNYSFVHNFGGFSNYSDRIPHGLNLNEDWNWWFRDTSFQLLGSAIVSAYNARTNAIAGSSYDIAVAERGASMVKAQLAANFATREDAEVLDFIEIVEDYAKTEIVLSNTPRTELYLKPDPVYQSRVAQLLEFTRNLNTTGAQFSPQQTDFYVTYQGKLREALEHYSSIDKLGEITVDASALDVNNTIRSFESLADLRLPTLLSPANRYIGLSGLSESGKSKIAEILAKDHGFMRFKLSFFNALARTEKSIGSPTIVANKILQFLIENKHINRASFESFHGPHLATELKLLLGDRWLNVYTDVEDGARQQRLLEQFPDSDPNDLLANQVAKDYAKNLAGVQHNKDFADIVLDNNSSIDKSIKFLLDQITL